jgi:hypothetical protein
VRRDREVGKLPRTIARINPCPNREAAMSKKRVRIEEFSVSGDELLGRVKNLIHGGNIRRITIKNGEGETLIEVPLTLGVVGAVLLPVWAALGAIAALVARLRIVVERIDEPVADGAQSDPGPAETEPEPSR